VATVAELTVMINADTAGAERGIALVQDKLFRFAIGMGGIGTAVSGAFVGFLTSAIDLETAMQNVNSIAQVSQEQIAEWTDEIQRLGVAFGEDPVKLAQGMYEIQSAGFAAADAIEILASAAKAGRAGLSDTGTAADAVTSIMNSYAGTLDTVSNAYTNLSTNGERAEYIQNVLFRAVDRGKMTYDELAGSVGRVGAVAASAGVSIEDIGAAFAVMTQQGLNADESATSLYNTINALIKPNQAMVDVLQQHGYESGQAAIADLGFVGVMEMLEEATGGSAAEIAKLFSNIRGQRGATLLMTGDFEEMVQAMLDAQPVINETTGEIERMGAMDMALAEQTKAASFGIDRMKAAILAFGQDITQVFLGPIADVTNGIADLFAAFLDLPKPVKDFLGLVLGLTGGMMALAAAIAIFLAIVGPILGWLVLATALFTGLSAAIAVTILAFKEFGAPGFVQNFFDKVSDSANELGDSLDRVASRVKGYWSGLQQMNVNSFSAVLATIGAFFQGLAREIPFLNKLDPLLIRIGQGFKDIGFAVERGLDTYRKYRDELKQIGTELQKPEWTTGIMAYWAGDLSSGTKVIAIMDRVFGSMHIWRRGIQGMAAEMKESFPQFTAFFDNLFKAADDFVEMLIAIGQGDWSRAWEMLWSAASESLDALGDLAGHILDALESAIRNVNWAHIRDILVDALIDIWNFISDQAIPWVMNTAIPTIGGWIASAAGAIWDFIVASYPYIIGWVSDLIEWIADFAAPEVGGWFLRYAGGVWNWLVNNGWGIVSGWTSDAIEWIADFAAPEVGGWLKTWAGNLSTWLNSVLFGGFRGSAMESSAGVSGSLIANIGNWLLNFLPPSVEGWIKEWAGKIGDFIKGQLFGGSGPGRGPSGGGGLIAKIEGWTLDIPSPAEVIGWIEEFAASPWEKIKGFYSNVEGWTSTAITWTLSTGGPLAIIGWIEEFAANAWTKIKGWLPTVEGWTSDAITWVLNTGIPSAIIGWIMEFVNDPWGKIKGWYAAVEGWTANVAMWILSLDSPSDVQGFFDDFGGAASDLGSWIESQYIDNETFSVDVPLTIVLTGTDFEWSPDLSVSINDNIAALGVIFSELREWMIILIGGQDNVMSLTGIRAAIEGYIKVQLGIGGFSVVALLKLFPLIVAGGKSISDAMQDYVKNETPKTGIPIFDLALKIMSWGISSLGSLPFLLHMWVMGQIGEASYSIYDFLIRIMTFKVDFPNPPSGGSWAEWLSDQVGGLFEGFLLPIDVGAEGEGAEPVLDAAAMADHINNAVATAVDNLSGASLARGLQQWVARAFQMAPIDAGPSSQALAEKINLAVASAMDSMSGASLGRGVQQWVARGLQQAPIDAGPSAQILLEKLNNAVVIQLGTFSGESLGAGISNWFQKAIETAQIEQAGLDAGTKFQQGLAQGLILAMESTRNFVSLTIARFTQFAADLRTHGLTAGTNFNLALTNGLKAADVNTQIQIANIKTKLTNFNNDARSAGLTSGQSFNTALTQGLRAAVANTQIQVAAIKSAMTFNASAQGNQAGVSFGAGVANGLYSMQDAVFAAGQALAIMANAGFNSISKPGSPSKLGIESGSLYGEGVVVGVENWIRKAFAAGTMLANSVAQPIGEPSRFGNMATAGRSTTVNNYFVLTPEELQRTMREASEGSDFARTFGFNSSAKLASIHEN